MARFAFFTLAQIVLDAPPSWWFAAYKFTLPASKRLRIDRLNAEMGAPSQKRRCRGGHGRLPCRAALDLVKRLAGHGLDGPLYGVALPASKRSFGGTKCVMPALPFYSWVCEW